MGGLWPFFERAHDGSRTDPQHPDDITHATAVEREIHDALFDCWQASGIMVLQEKDASGTVRIVTPIALGAIRPSGLARDHHNKGCSVRAQTAAL